MGESDTLSVKMSLSGMDAARAQFEAFGHTVEHSMGGAKESFMEFAKELAAPLLAAGTVAGIALLGERFREMNLQIEKGMKITGLGAEELAGMGYAAQKSDISLDALEHSMRHLSEWMVRTGQSGRNVKEVLLEQAALFKSMPDGMAKLNMAQERFGRGGMEMIQMLDKGPQELEAMFERGGKLSGINEQTIQSARQFADALIDFKLAAESLAGTLQNTFIPTLNKMLKGVTDLIVKFRDWHGASAVPGVAGEAAGVGGGLAATALGVNMAANIVSKTFGFGALTSVKDFTAAISLLGGRLLAMIGPIGLAIAGLTAITVTFMEMHKAGTAERQSAESAVRLTERNKELAASLLKLIDAREAEGKLTKEQAADMRNGVGSKNPSSAYMSRMADSLIPQSQGTGEHQWTKAELETANKMLDVKRQQLEISREYVEMENKGNTQTAFISDLHKRLDQERELISQKRSNAAQALIQKAIEQNEYDELSLTVRKEILGIDQKRGALAAEDMRIQREILDLNLKSMGERRSLLEQDFNKTAGEKREGSIAILKTEAARIQQEIETFKGLIAQMSAADPNRGAYQAGLNALQQQKMGTQNQLAQAQGTANPNSVVDQWLSGITKIKDAWGTLAQQISDTFSRTLNGAISTIATNLTSIINRTKNWRVALLDIGNTIVTTIIQSIIEMGIKWIVTHVLMQGVALAFHALMMALGLAQTTAAVANRATVTASSVSASTTEAAAAAPNALLQSIETFGVAALVGAAAFAVAMAAAGKFDQGGYTGSGGAQEPAGIVHKGEFVFDQASVARIGLGNLQAMHEGGAGSGYMKKIDGGGGIEIHMWPDEEATLRHIKNNPQVEHAIAGMIARNAHKFIPRRA
jgi:hypothetical protein